MRTGAAWVVLLGLMAVSTDTLAQNGRGRERDRGIPPGHLPPAGMCRVWYEDRPAGHQPSPTSCREAERVAARHRDARVVYGGDDRRNDHWWSRDERRDRAGRADPSRYPSPYPGARRDGDRSSNDRSGYRYGSAAVENGYKDGFAQGQEDGDNRAGYDPVRHGRYRSADHGYNERYGSKGSYRDDYREGFRAGYDEGYHRVLGPAGYGRQRRVQPRWPN